MSRTIARVVLIGLAYLAANKAALLLPDAEQVLALVWPAAGVGLAALLLNPRKLWPFILLAIFIAGNVANLLSGRPLINSLGFMTGNVLESFLSAWIMTLVCGPTIRFTRVREVLALGGVSTLVNAATACIGAGTASLAGVASFGSFWLTWWTGDCLGMLLGTTIIVAWAGVPPLTEIRPGRLAEQAAFLAVWSLASWWTFQPQDTLTFIAPKPYLLPILIIWPSLRLGMRLVTLALAALFGFVVLAPSGYEPFYHVAVSPSTHILHVQVFMAIMTMTSLILTSVISERGATEKALEGSENKLRAFVEHAPAAIIMLDDQLRYLAQSRRWLEEFNLQGQDLIGRHHYKVFPDIPEKWMIAHRQGLEGIPSSAEEDSFEREDGTHFWLNWELVPWRNGDGDVGGIMIFSEDITERKRLQELKDEVARTMRHDLRAPVGSALALVQIMRDDLVLSQEHEALLDTFEQSGRDMLDTLNSSLDLYKIETGRYSFTPETVDCLALVRDLGRVMVKTRFPGMGLDILLNGKPPGPGDSCPCLGQRNLTRIALRNLMNNAMEASSHGDTVRINLSCNTECRVEIGNRGTVPPDIRERFFEKYATSGKRRGTGIGTYSARLMIKAQDGEVTMKTWDDRNETLVTVILPAPAA